jgi:hypothetical protein
MVTSLKLYVHCKIAGELLSASYKNIRQIKIIGALAKKQTLETIDHTKCSIGSLHSVVCFTSCSL